MKSLEMIMMLFVVTCIEEWKPEMQLLSYLVWA